MKLIEKMILFSRFLRENNTHKLDLDKRLEDDISYFKTQSRYWKDKSSYEYLDSTLQQIKSLIEIYNNSISQVDTKVNKLLRQEEVNVIRRDYDNYFATERNLELSIQRFNKAEDWLKIIKSEIGNYTDWHYAGIELNPINGLLSESMLACDPFYIYTGGIADTDSIKSKFNNFFANKRLMFYNNLEKLPQNQLGTAVSINAYEFMPIDPIKDQMKKVFNLLRPGGYFLFTYSNCEEEAQLDLLHGPSGYISYNTKTLMESMIGMLGFDLIKEDCWREAQSYMIVKKPGELKSKKLSGPIVEIIDKI